jgi:hypothetical protein
LKDRRISAKSIAEQLGTSRERFGSIILEDLDMRKVTKWVLFMHDSAPAHRALAAQKKLAYLGFQCFDNPPYSPDLAPSDYHLFPGLKNKSLAIRDVMKCFKINVIIYSTRDVKTVNSLHTTRVCH